MTRRPIFRTLRGALALTLLTALAVPLTAAPARAVVEAPTLVSPAEGSTAGGNPVLTWEPVAGATRYRLAVSQSASFSPLAFPTVDTVNVQYAPPTKLPVGTVYWRVAAIDAANVLGPYTTATFEHQWAEAPNVVTPAADSQLNYPDDPLLFTWDPLAGAKTYNVQIANNEAFSGNPPIYTTNNTSYTLLTPQTNNQQFFWRVQGVSGSVVSPWSQPRAYTITWPEKPALLTPGADPVTDVVLSWTPVDGAVKYQVQVSPNQEFDDGKVVDVTTTGTRYSPPTTLANSSYYWRVRAVDNVSPTDEKANTGEWSSDIEAEPGMFVPAQFTREWLDRPTLLSPDHLDYQVTTPTFRWTPVPHATYYEIEFNGDDAFNTNNRLGICTTNQTTFTPYRVDNAAIQGSTDPIYSSVLCDTGITYPPVGGEVFWRVRAMDLPKGVNGLYSDVRSFQLKHQARVTLTGPADGATVDTPLLTWEPVQGVAQYRVTVIKGATVTSYDTYATSFAPEAVADTTYTWYVQTLDGAGRVGGIPLGGSRTFVYQPPAVETLGAYPVLLGPVDLASSLTMPAMTWTPVAGAKKYNVWSGVQGTNTYTLLKTTTVPAFTALDLPRSGTTQSWHVEALDANGLPISSSATGTYVVGTLAQAQPVSPADCTALVSCDVTPDTPTFSWDPVAGAGGYIVYLAKDENFTNIVRAYETTYTTFTPRESLLDSSAGQAYHWFVRPCRAIAAGGGAGCVAFNNETFPNAYAFRKESLAVELVSPAHDATASNGVTFAWKDYFETSNAVSSTQAARTYKIQVSTDADFSSRLDDAEVDQTTYTPYAQSYPDGPIYWRVWAIDGSKNPLRASPYRKVVKKTPALVPLHPANGAVESASPYFQWQAQPHVASYEVEVYKNGDALYSPSNKVTTASVTGARLTAYTPTTSLPAGQYAWRLRSRDVSGNAVAWSDGGTFSVAKSAPTLESPSDATVVKDNLLLFSWTGVTGAAQYRFESSTSPAFATTIESVDTVMTAWAPKVKYPEGTIYWRVKVLDAAGNVISTSSPLSIVKDSVGPTVTAKTPTTRGAVSGGSYTVTFSEPVKNVSTGTFVMKIAGTATPIAGTVTPGASTATTTATFKPTGTLVPGETYALSLSSGITDVNGNPLTPFTWNVRTDTTVDSASPAVSYFWDRDAATTASGGAYLASRTSGARVFYTFTGTSVSLLGRRATDGGYADVYLDGVKQTTKANFYATANQWKVPVWSKTGLANTTHKVEVRVLNSRPTGSSATWVYVDAFKVGTLVTEETSPAVVQTFRTVPLSGTVGGSYELNVHTASGDTSSQPYLLVKFKGTAISWKGFRSTAGGIAGVYVDNVGVGNVDTYGSATTTPQTLYTKSGLSNAQHTLKIVLRGTKRTASSGYNVTVDSFSVT